MSEVYTFSEGRLYLWTGSHTASGMSVAWCENVNVSIDNTWGYQRSIGTARYEWLQDSRATISIGRAYSNDNRVWALVTAENVHMKIEHENQPAGSAGFIFYSGRIDNAGMQANNNAIVRESVGGHAYQWTGW